MLEPEEVTAIRKSKSGTGTTNCKAVENRKYLFPLSELKESSRFCIVAHDYSTPWRDVTLVPPPMIDSLGIDREEPAYLYYRLLEDPTLLKAKRQQISSTNISTTGPKSDIDVPFGTHVAVTAHSDRKLKKDKDVRVAAPEKRVEVNSTTPPVEVHLDGDAQTFRVEFRNVQKIIEFDFKFEDVDGVKGSRRIVIRPEIDKAPGFNALGLGVKPREVTPSTDRGAGSQRYYCITPDAYILWRGTVEDNRGLAKLQYKYDLQELDFQYLFGDPDAKKDDKQPDDKKDPPKKEQPKRHSPTDGPALIVQGLSFGPGPSAYGFYASAYYSTLAHIVKEIPL